MFSRAVRVSQRLPSCRGPLNQRLNIRLASTEPADATPARSSHPRPAVRTAYVKAWRPPTNVAEVYAVVREIERKYGKIIETHFLRDFEDPTRYQMMSYIIFADPQSLQRIPEAGIELTVPSPLADKPYYEVGLDDVESTMFSQDTAETSQEALSDGSVMGFRLMRSALDYVPENNRRGSMFQRASYRTMEHFQNWGGFAPLEPLNPPRKMQDSDLFANSESTDQNRMRASLEICASNFRLKPSASSSRATPAAGEKPAQSIHSSGPITPPTALTPELDAAPPKALPSKITIPPVIPKPEAVAAKASSKLPKSDVKPTPKPVAKPAAKSVQENTPEVAKEASKTSASKETQTPPTADAPSASNTTQTSSTQAASTKKQKAAGPKLAIPPQVQKPSNPPRKDPKPKIKVAKEVPPKPQPAVPSEPPPHPEPSGPKGALGMLWGLFRGS